MQNLPVMMVLWKNGDKVTVVSFFRRKRKIASVENHIESSLSLKCQLVLVFFSSVFAFSLFMICCLCSQPYCGIFLLPFSLLIYVYIVYFSFSEFSKNKFLLLG